MFQETGKSEKMLTKLENKFKCNVSSSSANSSLQKNKKSHHHSHPNFPNIRSSSERKIFYTT
jgi:hypothetical protein